VPLATPSLRPCGRPLPSAVGTSPAIDHSLSGNSQTWPARHAAVTRPTLLLLKELFCLCRGVSCSHRADKPVRAISADTNLDANLDLGIFMVAFMGRVHGPRSLHPVGTFGTNDTTDANRWVSHARVKRSDQSCRRRHSQTQFVQRCCAIRHRLSCVPTRANVARSKANVARMKRNGHAWSLNLCSRVIFALNASIDSEAMALSPSVKCCAHQPAAGNDVATTKTRGCNGDARDRQQHRFTMRSWGPELMGAGGHGGSAAAARARSHGELTAQSAGDARAQTPRFQCHAARLHRAAGHRPVRPK